MMEPAECSRDRTGYVGACERSRCRSDGSTLLSGRALSVPCNHGDPATRPMNGVTTARGRR
jgi:hypothetical protein